MKVLFLTPRYFPSVGGVEVHLAEVVKILVRDGINVTIVTEQYAPQLKEYEVKDAVTIWRIPMRSTSSKKFTVWLWFLRHLNIFFAADIIHIHDVFFWFLPFRKLFFWKKVFMTFHGYEAPGPLTFWQIFWHQCAALCSDGNICVGDFHRAVYGVQPTYVTYGGVQKVPLLQPEPHKYIFVGRISNDTGILAYLKALFLLQQSQHYEYHLDVYGDGPLLTRCQKFVQDFHLPVTFHGFTPNATQFFGKYEVILASQYLSILQALSLEIPIIAYADTPLKKTYLRMTPFASEISIAQQPSEIAQFLLHHEEPSINAVTWAQQQTWEEVALIYQQLWHE